MVDQADPALAPSSPFHHEWLAARLRGNIRALAALALVACSPAYLINSNKAPELATLHAIYVISDVGDLGDREAKEFQHELGNGLRRCNVQAQISMTLFFESNPEVHLRAARQAGAKHLLTIRHDGGITSVSPLGADYEANLYDLGDGQVRWRATIDAAIDTIIFGADLARVLYNRLAQDQVVPRNCSTPVVQRLGSKR
jgi:hypothetical protein